MILTIRINSYAADVFKTVLTTAQHLYLLSWAVLSVLRQISVNKSVEIIKICYIKYHTMLYIYIVVNQCLLRTITATEGEKTARTMSESETYATSGLSSKVKIYY